MNFHKCLGTVPNNYYINLSSNTFSATIPVRNSSRNKEIVVVRCCQYADLKLFQCFSIWTYCIGKLFLGWTIYEILIVMIVINTCYSRCIALIKDISQTFLKHKTGFSEISVIIILELRMFLTNFAFIWKNPHLTSMLSIKGGEPTWLQDDFNRYVCEKENGYCHSEVKSMYRNIWLYN